MFQDEMVQPAKFKEECNCDASPWPHWHIMSYVDVHAKLMAMTGMLELLYEKHTRLMEEHGETLQAGGSVDPTGPTAGGVVVNRGLRLPDEELRSGSRASSGDELGVSHDGRSDGGSSRRGRKDTVGDDAEPPDPDEFDELGSNPSGGNTPRGQMMMTTTTKFDKTRVCMELIEMMYSQAGGIKRAFHPGSIRVPLDFVDGFFNSKFQKSQLDVIMRPYRGLTKPVKESKSDEGSGADLAINAFAEMIHAVFAMRFKNHEVQNNLIAVLKTITSKEYTEGSRRGKPSLASVLARSDSSLLAANAGPGDQPVDQLPGMDCGNPPKSAVSGSTNSDGHDGLLPGLNPPPLDQMPDDSCNASVQSLSLVKQDTLAPGDGGLQPRSVSGRRLLKSGSSNQARIKMLEDQVSGLTSLVETLMSLQGDLPEKEMQAFANGLKRVKGYEQSRAAMARVMAVSSNSAVVASRVGSSRSMSSTKSVKGMRSIRDALPGGQGPNLMPPGIGPPRSGHQPSVKVTNETENRPSSADSLSSSFSDSICSSLDS